MYYVKTNVPTFCTYFCTYFRYIFFMYLLLYIKCTYFYIFNVHAPFHIFSKCTLKCTPFCTPRGTYFAVPCPQGVHILLFSKSYLNDLQRLQCPTMKFKPQFCIWSITWSHTCSIYSLKLHFIKLLYISCNKLYVLFYKFYVLCFMLYVLSLHFLLYTFYLCKATHLSDSVSHSRNSD